MEAKTHIRQLRTIANSNNIQSHFMITGLLKRIILLTAAVASITVGYAMPHNIAHSAKVTASSCRDAHTLASNAVDGKIRILNKGEWVSKSAMTFWGEIDYPWIQLDWDNRVTINKVILYDRPELNTHIAGGVLKFSDGTSVLVNQIPDDGSPKVVEFSPRHTDFVRFEVTDADGIHVGLSEIEVYPAPDDYKDYVSWVDPYIETARGRYFFFITGNQPFGMIGAAPLTRNKNQYGGGYNFNSTNILGFPQLHCWMLSGLTIMPTANGIDPTLGEQGWLSGFSHDGEVAQPGYHRLYLDRYHTWVEQTATDRVGFYRFTYTREMPAEVLINLGGYTGTSTMVNAHAQRNGDNEICGYFDTRGRLWGGPDVVRIYFVVQLDKVAEHIDSWADGIYEPGKNTVAASKRSTRREASGWSYEDAPTAGLKVKFDVQPGDQIQLKTSVSFVNVENARLNMSAECSHWDFDAVRKQSQTEWNEWLGRIDVDGGSDNQKIKFYTDLWHTLLGRHKIDDINGEYPDYTQGERQGPHTINAQFKKRQLPLNNDGTARHHMYNSDAFWLTQWNLNTLWGLAYPEVLDDFAASLIQYSLNGKLLPRGPNVGGYSYIMSGCPATSLITSAYQCGITKKWDIATGYKQMKLNHEKGGMLALDMDHELDFYKKYGYCPDNAGYTIQWAFEDWAIGQMALKLNRRKDYNYFNRRASGWTNTFNHELKMIMPRRKNREWLHTDLFSGWGWIESNAWQATFGVSHDIPRLAELMGGNDTLCSKLNHAFIQSASSDFVYGYGKGYVSYANQPGLSNAHVFSHAGKPWLTQYWVRRVKEQAYGSVTPDLGYGGHDEDQGQMGCVSALMAIGLFSIDGCSAAHPSYEITSPVFNRITIKLNPDYYKGKEFTITTVNNSSDNCYIKEARLNGQNYNSYKIPQSKVTEGGTLELILDSVPNQSWGISSKDK